MAFWSLTKEEAQPAEPVAHMDAATLKAELDHAYDRGRSHEKSRRLGRGLLMTVLVILSAVGVTTLALGARDGSFAAAGAQADQTAQQAMSSLNIPH